ncbi:MAG: gliding motility-associated C-terminal domain-containing protein, partial [Vicingaceae bacterium]
NGAKNLETLNVQIFNRWGIKVGSWELGSQQKASTTAYTLWNGTTTAGKKVPDGIYFYVLNYKINNAELKSKKGSITLLR